MESDRRQTQRVEISVPVTVEGIWATREAKIKNFSAHGMCYTLPAEASVSPEEKEVFLRFSLLERIHPIRVMGWVVHNQVNDTSNETGVTFMFLSPKDEEILQDFAERKSE
ncbi:MAG: PilZ domain-containing protein [Desulfoprunum sp.]|nr:PilZ domain-containing protein [Desulfoprunum sp.]